jgi:hypothetical protein
MDLPESAGPTIPRRGKAAADPALRRAKAGFPARRRANLTAQQKGRPAGRPFSAKAG